ncbi:MAG: DsrE family protein [Elusimicrobia bacterium]|nr:DsrE family protein [Elusimicrobiota bacterium]
MAVFSVVIFGAELDRLYEAVAFAAAARARGENVILFFRGPALKAFIEKQWPPPTAVSVDSLHFQNRSPSDYLDGLRQAGGVRVYACSAWARLLKLTSRSLAQRTDAVVGLNAFLSQAQGGPVLTF